MARISGMILGLGFLIVLSSLASPVSAWDHDDDDDKYKRRRGHARHGIRQPIFIPPRHVERHYYGGGGYTMPYNPAPYNPAPYYPAREYPAVEYPPVQQGPIVPPPLPPSAFHQEGYGHQGEEIIVPPAPPVDVLSHTRPGQFVNAAVPLYPLVRVKNQEEAPRFGLHQILAVTSPDPVRFPGCVYVKVCVPPGPCRDVEVKDGGATIKLKYEEYEVEVESRRGVVTVEYDD